MAQLTPYSQGTQEISFQLHSFEMPWRLMGQWTNSNIRHTVTDGPFRRANMSRCTYDPKTKNPYWATGIGNNSGEISDDTAGIIDIAVKVIPC